MRLRIVSLPFFLLTALVWGQPANAPLLPLDDLHPGMQGEVWTVFRGTEPEPFAVEVTGVVRNALGPGKSLILCQLTDERVQKMGAVAGMSGSPLYVNGRLAGALAYQVQKFETVRYAGFTPIADLLEVRHKSDQAAARADPSRKADLSPAATASDSGLQPLTPVFTGAGLSPLVVDWLAPQFAALGLRLSALGGQMESGDAAALPDRPLQAGDAVAVALATGDITLAATGTVSHVDGSNVLAFGHPMLGLGDVALPLARAEIVTILPSNQNSLKVANTGAIIGTVDQDRLSAVAAQLGPVPPMIPVEIVVHEPGHAPRILEFSSARHAQLTPLAVGAGAAQAVLGSNDAGLTHGVRLEAEFEFPAHGPVRTATVLSGPQGMKQSLADFTADIGALLQNPYAEVFPARIRLNVIPLAENPLTTLETMQLSRSHVTPGDTLHITLGWRDFQGTTDREILSLTVPSDWRGKSLAVIATNGRELDKLTGRAGVIAAAQLRGFDAYLDFVRQARANDGLAIAVVETATLFVDQTAVTRDLPGSLARIARGSDQNRYQIRQAAATLWEQQVLPGRVVPGLLRQTFTVGD